MGLVADMSNTTAISVINELESFFKCDNCNEFFDSPTENFKCGHALCTNCLTEVPRKNCKVCGSSSNSKDYIRNLYISNLIPNILCLKRLLEEPTLSNAKGEISATGSNKLLKADLDTSDNFLVEKEERNIS